jgi:hypothetical protein
MWIISQVFEGTDNFPRAATPKVFYHEKKTALKAAKSLARDNPQVQYAVFKIDTIFEAAEPTVVEKFINEDGETEVRK